MADTTQERPSAEAQRMIDHPANADEESVAHSWGTTPTAVLIDVDAGIAPLVAALNTIDGIRTRASCQGHLLGVETRAYVMISWIEPHHFHAFSALLSAGDDEGWALERVDREQHAATLYVQPAAILGLAKRLSGR